MHRIAALFLFIVLYSTTNGQEVQWATRLMDFSSQLSDYEYSAEQVLDKPNVLPNPGDNPNAWMPDNPDKLSYIKVGFETPIRVEQVAIAESYNPGSVKEIYLYDERDREYRIISFNPRPLPLKGRLLNLYIPETEYNVRAAKIVIDGSSVPGYNAIDAIGISGTKVPIEATQNMALRQNPDQRDEMLGLNADRTVFDIKPVFSDRLNTLFFTRSFSPENTGGSDDPGDIWFSTLDLESGEFGDPQPAVGAINSIGFNTVEGFYLLNETEILLAANISGKPNKSEKNVVLISGSGNQWENIRKQKIKSDNIVSGDADYTLANDGNVLIISTVRYDTEGGKDLYICFKDGNDKWTEPENMGKKINTAFDEIGPFYAENEKALYISTAGFSGFGKSDIFRMIRQDDSWKNWSEPENIGTDVNTEEDEHFFYFDASDDHAYFARGDADSVYRIHRIDRPRYIEPTPLVALSGSVSDNSSGVPLNSEVSVVLLPDESPYGVTISDSQTGKYEIFVPSGYEYRITGVTTGYKAFTSNISLENKGQTYGYEFNIQLESMTEQVTEPVVAVVTEEPEDIQEPVTDSPVSETVTPVVDTSQPVSVSEKEMIVEQVTDPGTAESYSVNEVLFDFNSDLPIQESLPILNRIAEFLLDNEDVKIEVAGFTDHIGNELFNAELGRRRAVSVKKFLTDKGISSTRIRVLGFGEKMPLIYSDDIKDLRINRRVEFNFTRY